MEEVKGLEVDSLGRLWAVDVGSNNSPAKLWIFNLSNGDSVALVHQFSSLVVSYTYNRRDLRKPVLDETANDSLAYIPDVNTNKIVVFSEKRNESWSVQVKERIYFSALALSPKNKRDFVYLGDHVQTYKNLYKIPISNLKKGGKVEVSPSFVGSRNGSSWKMLMDSRGTLYFDVRTDQDEQGRIATWNTNTPFNEEITFQFQFSLTRYSIAFDTCGNLWLLLWDGRKYQLLKAAVGAKSYLYNDSDAFTACGKRISDSTVGSGNAAIDCSGLRHLNVVLSCWNLFAFFSIGLQIFWFRALTRKKYAILKTKKEQEETYMPADDPANFQRTSFTPGEPIYEEVKPCTSSNSTCLESQC
ncbi:uncharacterized protein LOC135937044 [Cloeon dipterum]|uniref:uncharacterized protein LOC135937044 n=1 Tax=Cloeon dipterum TaxID=197152 RepID=UPI00322083E7